jgi:hypothetical protein
MRDSSIPNGVTIQQHVSFLVGVTQMVLDHQKGDPSAAIADLSACLCTLLHGTLMPEQRAEVIDTIAKALHDSRGVLPGIQIHAVKGD